MVNLASCGDAMMEDGGETVQEAEQGSGLEKSGETMTLDSSSSMENQLTNLETEVHTHSYMYCKYISYRYMNIH